MITLHTPTTTVADDFAYLAYVSEIHPDQLYSLMVRYGDDVQRYAYSLTNHTELAKDIAQEVFIRVYQKIHTFKGQASIKTWLLTITRNMALNELRSSYFKRIILHSQMERSTGIQAGEFSVKMTASSESNMHHLSASTAASAEDVVMEDMLTQEVEQLVMRLPRKLREVLLLRIRHDLSMQEIAQLLHVAEGTVKSRLHRARKAMDLLWEGR